MSSVFLLRPEKMLRGDHYQGVCQSRVRSEDGSGFGLAYYCACSSLTMTPGGRERNGVEFEEGRK